MEAWSLAVVAALVLGYAAVSRRLERTVVSSAMVFVAGGLATGPDGLGWLDLNIGSSEVRVLAEATLTLVLFLDASRINAAGCGGSSVCPFDCSCFHLRPEPHALVATR